MTKNEIVTYSTFRQEIVRKARSGEYSALDLQTITERQFCCELCRVCSLMQINCRMKSCSMFQN